MVRVAIVGCGKIADQHVQAVRRIEGSDIVAVCDREPRMAQQLAERFAIRACFADVAEMLRMTSADVVHITTPPQSHHALAKQCLESGAHVYVEKPFTVDAPEAEALIALARSLGRIITAGHNYQFTAEMETMRRLVAQGFLGGRPVHIESHWSYDLGDASYVGPLVGNPDHWVRRLPGGLFHNIVSHGIARLAEFLDDDLVQVIATAHQSETLRGFGVHDLLDELRVLIRDKTGTTAWFCFSTQLKPGLNRFQIYGPANSIHVDLVSGTATTSKGRSYKSYLTYLVPPWLAARDSLRNLKRNVVDIARMRLHQDFGMKTLIERFHQSVTDRSAPPIPYREILLTARIMDTVFAQIASRPAARDAHAPLPVLAA
jgi:predicted dehydrogenase